MQGNKVIELITLNFLSNIDKAESLDKNSIKYLFKETVLNVILENCYIEDITYTDNDNLKWIYDDEKETLDDKKLRAKRNLELSKDKSNNYNNNNERVEDKQDNIESDITEKQLKTIRIIESKLGIKFEGNTKREATQFIGDNIEKSYGK